MSFPDTSTKFIKVERTALLKKAAKLISLHSWGENYPINPLTEIEMAEHRIGVTHQNELIAFASVGRGFSPDQLENDLLWLAYVVVAPKFQRLGIFNGLYNAQMRYAGKTVPLSQIRTCTDNYVVETFLKARGWKITRQTKDESGENTLVLQP